MWDLRYMLSVSVRVAPSSVAAALPSLRRRRHSYTAGQQAVQLDMCWHFAGSSKV